MTFYHSFSPSAQLLRGKTLIVPVVSVANVSQLAVDLLIATLTLKRVGIFDARDLIPVVGGREDGEKGVTTPLELYGKDGLDIVVIQQRSPAIKARKESFIRSILDFIQEFQLGSFLLLSGVDLSNRADSQMNTPTYAILPPQTPPLASTLLSDVKRLPVYTFSAPSSNQAGEGQSSRQLPDIPFIPGGGLTRRILSSLPSPWPIPTACILQFALEGDNRADALLLASVVAKLLKLDQSFKELRQPGSWKEGLFGTPHDQTLFG